MVHLQWKLADWDPRWGGIPRMETVLQSLRRPVVVTMHDVFDRDGVWQRRLSLGAIGLRRLGRADYLESVNRGCYQTIHSYPPL